MAHLRLALVSTDRALSFMSRAGRFCFRVISSAAAGHCAARHTQVSCSLSQLGRFTRDSGRRRKVAEPWGCLTSLIQGWATTHAASCLCSGKPRTAYTLKRLKAGREPGLVA